MLKETPPSERRLNMEEIAERQDEEEEREHREEWIRSWLDAMNKLYWNESRG
jgi:hypothetical protein